MYRKRIGAITLALWLGLQSTPLNVLADTVDGVWRTPNVTVNQAESGKNWFRDYASYYPVNSLPATAPSSVGFKSLSSSGEYEYKTDEGDLEFVNSSYYIDNFREIFYPSTTQKQIDNVITTGEDTDRVKRTATGVDALDTYESTEYKGLTEEELKWLILNDVITRDVGVINIGSESIEMGEPEPLYVEGQSDTIRKTDFLMALHKATYGVIESRPIVFDVNSYRNAQRIEWIKVYDDDGDLIGYERSDGPLTIQQTSDVELIDNSELLFRGEYAVKLANDDQYVMSTYQNGDKMVAITPNVFELYLKSYIDKGIISDKNLNAEYASGSKNGLKDTSSYSTALANYGTMQGIDTQMYPDWAPEAGVYSLQDGNQNYFKVSSTDAGLWGDRYSISESSITPNENVDYFLDESMTSMDALKFIAAIMRQEEGDMTDTEAEIVSYKYGASLVDNFEGEDRSTVMYLTAKGVINFEDQKEYEQLYSPLEKDYAYMLLYRVANKNARLNFSEIQLTDSDNFWIGQGFSSYPLDVKKPDYSSTSNYIDDDGAMTYNPVESGDLASEEKVQFNLIPDNSVELIQMTEKTNSKTKKASSSTKTVKSMEGFLVETDGDASAVDDSGIDRYNMIARVSAQEVQETVKDPDAIDEGIELEGDLQLNEDGSIESNDNVPLDDNEGFFDKLFNDTFNMGASIGKEYGNWFADEAEPEVASDVMDNNVKVTMSVDDPFKYTYDTKEIADTSRMPGSVDELLETKMADGTFPDIKAPDEVRSSDISSVTYNEDTRDYTVVFNVVASTVDAAHTYVKSKLEAKSDTVAQIDSVDAIYTVDNNGVPQRFVSRDQLTLIDTEILVVEDNILLNRRTGTRAVILADQDIAYVGSKIVETTKDNLIRYNGENVPYYNLEIIGSLMSNQFLSDIGLGSLYCVGGLVTDSYEKVYSDNGTEIGLALVENVELEVTNEEGDLVANSLPFVNINMLDNIGNYMIKEISIPVDTAQDLTFNIMINWTVGLPTSSSALPSSWFEEGSGTIFDPLHNPTQEEMNDFFFTEPDISNTELYKWWVQNIEVSNALANSLYGTDNVPYVASGYLVPNITILINPYYSDSKYATVLDTEVTANIGSWFQDVGARLSTTWSELVVSDTLLYNKIVVDSSNETQVEVASSMKFTTMSDDVVNTDEDDPLNGIAIINEDGTVDEEGGHDGQKNIGYKLLKNGEGTHYGDKTIPFFTYPAWVHIFYNNKADVLNEPIITKLASERTFDTVALYETVNNGDLYRNVYNVQTPDIFMLKNTGALYQAIVGTDFSTTYDGIVSNNRVSGKTLNGYVGTVVEYAGSKYYLHSIDEQYMNIVALDGVQAYFNEDSTQVLVGGVDAGQVGWDHLSTIFTKGVPDYTTMSNELPDSGVYYPNDTWIATMDADGDWTSSRFEVNEDGNNVREAGFSNNNLRMYYNPSIKLSVNSWDIQNGYLVQQNTIPSLNYSGFYTKSITSAFIDGILGESDATMMDMNEVAPGTRIQMGDIFVTKMADGTFTTDPIDIATLQTPLNVMDDGRVTQDSLDRVAGRAFNQTFGSKYTPASFMQSVRLASSSDVNEEGVICSPNNDPLYFSITGNFLEDLKNADGLSDAVTSITDGLVSINFGLQDGLSVMPTSKDLSSGTGTAVMLNVMTATPDGTGINNVYFAEYADYTKHDYYQTEFSNADYEVFPYNEQSKKAWLQAHEQQKWSDFKTIASYVLIGGVIFFTLMLWFSYALLSIPLCRTLMEMVRRPNKSMGGVGFDIIKILSFGRLSIDDEIPSLSKIMAMSMLPLVVITIIVIVMYSTTGSNSIFPELKPTVLEFFSN